MLAELQFRTPSKMSRLLIIKQRQKNGGTNDILNDILNYFITLAPPPKQDTKVKESNKGDVLGKHEENKLYKSTLYKSTL
jgi:hypothetical protein